ncbi:MAG: ABC transporter ATP-binding protein, partial [Clostridiaceae bacterium]|nr:ABC transporter ATP-binding protein [Clostridiaceae bacterium]
EEGSFFPYMTAEEYGFFLTRFFDSFDLTKYHKLLNFFEIETNAKLRTMSKGQKAKVETAAGFSKGADIILMDEPFSGKDMVTRKEFLKLINTSLRTNETILIATHLVDEIENMLDRAIILKYGRLIADFYMDEILEQGISLSEKCLETGGYDSVRFKELLKV